MPMQLFLLFSMFMWYNTSVIRSIDKLNVCVKLKESTQWLIKNIESKRFIWDFPREVCKTGYMLFLSGNSKIIATKMDAAV